MHRLRSLLNHPVAPYLGLIIILSYLTYVVDFATPAAFFWDENYHIASAQKYLTGTYFMEPHPPLGKMLIALGEKIIDANPVDDQFIGTDYAKSPPEGFSFVGYRFFPVMLAWLTAPLLFGIFFLITRTALLSTVLSFLYVFDNALIVHLRGAMLESTLLFFVVATIFAFLLALNRVGDPKKYRNAALLFGCCFGAAMATKVTALILILLVPLILRKAGWRHRKPFLLWSVLGFALVYCTVWYAHFAIGKTVNPDLPDDGYYKASPVYRQVIDNGLTGHIRHFPLMLRDSIRFLPHYTRGVPKLNLCKADENGAPFFFWPLGGRSINYRWETPDGFAYHYLYLQVNPVVWWISFGAVLLAIAALLLPYLFPLKEKLKHRFLLSTFVILWVCYMIAIARLDRVMYLYHYFMPLLFSFMIVAVLSQEITRIGRRTIDASRALLCTLAFGLLIFVGFQAYRPLTYYEPVSNSWMERRAFFPLWELHCIKCEKESLLTEGV